MEYDVDVQKVGGEFHFQVASGAEFVPRLIGDFGGRVKSVQSKRRCACTGCARGWSRSARR